MSIEDDEILQGVIEESLEHLADILKRGRTKLIDCFYMKKIQTRGTFSS